MHQTDPGMKGERRKGKRRRRQGKGDSATNQRNEAEISVKSRGDTWTFKRRDKER
jgi:hypothetical protein